MNKVILLYVNYTSYPVLVGVFTSKTLAEKHYNREFYPTQYHHPWKPKYVEKLLNTGNLYHSSGQGHPQEI